jgi:hypothetical protein
MKSQDIPAGFDAWFAQRSRLETWGMGVLILAVVGIVDHITGVEILLNFLYLVPVSVVTWRLGRTMGLLMALGCAAVCAGIDWLGRPGLSPLVASWNVLGDFGIFAIYALALTRITGDLVEERRLNTELQTALSQVKTLSGLLPICAWCNKIRDGSGHWHRLEEYLSSHAEVDITHSICPECKAKLHQP